MEALKDNQLLLLDIIIYCFEREAPVVVPGATLRELADDVDNGLKRRMLDRDEKLADNVAEQMSYLDLFEAVDAIRRDRQLRELVLDSYNSDERGAKMAAFREPGGPGGPGGGRGRCYVIFAGTGHGEWEDDCVSAYQRDSEQQLRALAWFDAEVLGRGYADIVASGHSKGGNKAQYLAVRRGSAVSRAVSFDGEGFSREFLAAYPDLIAEHARQIVAYALDNDFVNGLLNPISLPQNRHYLSGRHVEQLAANHSPFALFAPRGEGERLCRAPLELAPRGEQGEIGKMMVALTSYLQTEPDHDEFVRICGFLGKALENIVASGKTNEERRRAFSELYASGDFPLATGYLIRFFQTVGRKVSPADIVRFFMPKGEAGEEDVDSLAEKLKDRLPERLKGRMGPGKKKAAGGVAGVSAAGTGSALAPRPDAALAVSGPSPELGSAQARDGGGRSSGSGGSGSGGADNGCSCSGSWDDRQGGK